MTETKIFDDAPFQDLKARSQRLIDQIDARGGWPATAGSLVLKHGSDGRECYFSKAANVRDGWNTSIMTADEYYWSKISDTKKELIRRKNVRDALSRAMPPLD